MIRKEGHKAVISTAAASTLGGIIELIGKKMHVPVINIVRSEKQSDLLKFRGVQYVLNSSSDNFENELQSLAAQLKATLALDAIGGGITGYLIRAVPFGSTVLVYGNLSGEQPQMDHRSLVTDNKKVSGFYLPNWLREQGMLTTVKSILRARALLKSDINLPVHARFPLHEVNQAAGLYLENMTAGKVLLIPGL
jgi:NADPH:quinone reductase-like Zn-dependent oxidoreductase